MTVPIIRTAFAAGEITPELYGHVDLEKFGVAATTMRNMAVSFRGGCFSRAGTAYCLLSGTPYSGGVAPRVITFQFSTQQGLCIEMGPNYMRFFVDGEPVLEPPSNISAITQADPAVVTAPGNNFVANDWVQINGVNGMSELNGRTFLVASPVGGSFNLESLFTGLGLNTTGYAAYVSGGTASRVYTLATPYAAADVNNVKFTQSADVISLTHPSYPPYELTRVTDADWTLVPAQIGSAIGPPSSTIAAATVQPSQATSPPTLPCAYAYVVTSVDANGNESVASPIANITNGVDMGVTAGSNIVDWLGVVGAVYYNIYRAPTSYNTLPGNTTTALPVPAGAIFSFVGFSYGNQFIDSNITPDTTQTPPLNQNPFAPGAIPQIQQQLPGTGYTTAEISIVSGTGSGFSAYPVILSGQVFGWVVTNPGQGYSPGDTAVITGDGSGALATIELGPTTGTYPSVDGYLQQRRVYANSNNQPDTYWMSVPGQYLNFNSGLPSEASDAITGTPWSQQVNGIQWLVQVSGVLVVMTGGGLWQVTGTGGSPLTPQPITPASQQALAQNFSGISSQVQPLQIKNEIIYVDALGSVVWSSVYSYFTNNWPTTDLTVLSGHLLTGFEAQRWAWCEQPNKTIWTVRSDGVLLSLAYLKEQEVAGWARHDTLGQFVCVTAVREPPVDALYCVVARPQSAAVTLNYYNGVWDPTVYQGGPFTIDTTGEVLSVHESAGAARATVRSTPAATAAGLILFRFVLDSVSAAANGVLGFCNAAFTSALEGGTVPGADFAGNSVSFTVDTALPSSDIVFKGAGIGTASAVAQGDTCVFAFNSSTSEVWLSTDGGATWNGGSGNPFSNVGGYSVAGIGGGPWYAVALLQTTSGAATATVALAGAVDTGAPWAYFIERMDNRLWLNSEAPWCVDCGLALEQPAPAVGLTASSSSGSAVFTASGAVFSPQSVGQVIRMSGGIAAVTAYNGPTSVSGTWNLPPSGLVPNDPNNGVLPAAAGSWTITPPVTTIYGLDQLAGESVVGLADGVLIGPITVSPDGAIELPFPASAVTLGLPFTPQVQTTYLDAGNPTIQGRRKNIVAVTARVTNTQGVNVGTNQTDGSTLSPQQVAPPWSNLSPDPAMNGPTYISPSGQTVNQLVTGDLRADVLAAWAKPGQIAIQGTPGLPMTVLAVIPETLEGDVPETQYAPDRPQGRGRQEREPRPVPGMWMLQE
jgi:hypothetical protein